MGFQQGLSGLNAASKQLDVIGNNIANSSTIGFKSSRTEFSDLYASTLAATVNTQSGIGVQTVAVSQQFQQGNITSTNNPLDMAISGNGFFRVTSDNTPNGGIEAFSRNGEFKLDKEGYIVNNGYYLNGYRMVNGVKTGAEQPLQVSTINSGIAKATGAVGERGIDWSFNLDGSAKVIDPAVKPFDSLDATTYSYTSGAKFYDNYGNVHTVSVYFARRAPTIDPVVPATVPPSTLDVNNWDVYHAVDGTLVAGAPTQVKFDQAGQLTAWSDNTITIAADTSAASAHPQFDIDFTGSTQFSGDFSVASQVVGGYAAGKFTGVSADSTGVIYAKYTNGITEPIGQLTLYNFANIQGLTPNGGNRWLYTSDAGARSMADPNAGGMGSIKSSALEESNVDTTAELVNMIVAQRFYQANAQTIKTQDTIMQTLLNLR
ncbi:flagellar hook protein FlgE [Vogesella sp. LYT5W]|uniref:Flagellar hook protein FlgE n=1 Tax=Vogesella margarita TaxID=2984199 RepID=A0ABT5INK2_9NEIS|nr:flagellar hook protein FlgE [Vogesella margarita]MDC7713778.1 flagellar hook protein FlgE [Vogesella margarita]